MPTNDDYWNHTQPVGQPQRQQPADESQQQLAGESQQQQPAGESQQQQPVGQPQQSQPASQPPVDRLQQQQSVGQSQQSQPQQPQQYQAQQSQRFQQPQQPPQYQAQPQPVYASPQQYAPYMQQKGKSHGWIVAIVIVVCLFAFSIFCVNKCTSAFGSLSAPSASAVESLTGDAVAIIDIDGTIQYDGSACSPEGLKELLDEAEENSFVKAVVLRVNSGGGTATAGEEMAEYVRQFAEVKPIVVSSASINASAAYEISSQADYIFVAKSTEIGAIGTAMQLTDISGLLDMLGVDMEVITSSEEKDSSYGYRPLTDDERSEYQHMVDQINSVFVQNVADGRGMTLEQVKALATGMPFTGIDAVENGLADAIGTREDAVKKAAELAGISSYTTTTLSLSDYDLSSLAYLFGKTDTSAEDLVKLLKSDKGANLL